MPVRCLTVHRNSHRLPIVSGLVLVVAAHPDDEVLGCGGTLARHSANGDEVVIAFLSDGESSRRDATDGVAITARNQAALEAATILGGSIAEFGQFADNQLDSVPVLEICRKVEQLVSEYRPDVIYTHHGGDLNVDHRLAHQAVMTAARPQQGSPVRTILSFETPSSTEWQPVGYAPTFTPSWFVDISQTFETKLAALLPYSAELREWPHPRSLRAIEALARWRGASVGCEAAEAFTVSRHIR